MTRETILFYLLPPLFAFLVVHPFIWVVRKLALRFRVVDIPNLPRKVHHSPVPLWGGMAVYLAFVVCVAVFYHLGWLVDIRISEMEILAIVGAGLLLIIGGALDDKYNLSPARQFIWPLLASLLAVVVGIKVGYVTNPLGGIIYLDKISWEVGGIIIYPLAQLIAWFWLLGMMYTTKFLDGLDGLVAGITTIGALIIFIVSLSWDVPWSATSVLALLVAGVFAGFFLWNFHPARIFLGEGGSTLAGLLLGILAIISGSKIATTLLVMGLPILDVVWVISRRIFWEKRSPVRADRKHLHFRLLDAGFSHSRAVLFLLFTSTVFGAFGLFQSTKGKLFLFSLLIIYMVGIALWLVSVYRRKNTPLTKKAK